MISLYLDSSALAKRYLVEVGTLWLRMITNGSAGNTILLGEITRVEVVAALATRHRARTITVVERNDAVKLFLKHCVTEYQIIPLTSTVVSRAILLTQQYRLRAYDAVQLATALVVNEQFVATGLSNLTFIAADNDLLLAARAEALAADNPLAHP